MARNQTWQPFIAVALFLFILCPLYSQSGMVKILDAQSGQLVPYTSVQIVPLAQNSKKIYLPADSGTFLNPILTRSIIKVKCLGYIASIDTLLPNQSKSIHLFPDPLYVNEVVITGQGKPVPVDQSIYMINIISNQQINDKAATNLTELLSNELDLRTFQDPILGTNLTMQGLSGEQVKILVDGIPVIGRQDGILDLSQLSLSNIDHVEMIEGPMSVIYGSNALAGVVDLITKDPDKSKSIGRLNTYYESVGICNFDGSVALKMDHHQFLFNCGRNFFGGYSATDTSRSQDWKPKVQYFGGFDYKYSTNRSKLHLGVDYFNEELLNLGGLFLVPDSILQKGKYIGILRYNATDLYQYTTRTNLKFDYTLKWSDQELWQTLAAYSYYNQTIKAVETNPVTLVQTPAPSMDQDTTNFYDVMCRSTFSENGINWMNYITGFDGVTETGTGNLLNGPKEIDEEAVFLTATLFPKRKLNFEMGARYIRNSKYNAPLVYSLNLKYHPTSELTLRSSFGKGFRSPSLQELYLDFVNDNHDIHGNDSLKAEYSYNFNFSIGYTIPFEKQNVSFDGSLFYNVFHDKIDFLYNASDPTWAEYYNIPEDKYITEGGKLIVTYRLQPGFEINGGFYFLGRSKIGLPGQFYYTRDYSCNLNYQLPTWHLRFSAFYKYFDNWYANALNKEINGPSIEYVQAYSFYKGYQSLNFTLSRPFINNRLDAALGIKNFFNVQSVSSFSTGGLDPHTSAGNGDTPIGWGRTFFIRLSYNFTKK